MRGILAFVILAFVVLVAAVRPAASDSKAGRVFKSLHPLPLAADVPVNAELSVVDGGAMKSGHAYVVFISDEDRETHISLVISASPKRMPYSKLITQMADLPATMDEAIARIANSAFELASVNRKEKTDDGWIIEAIGKGAEPTKQGYAIEVRRTLGGSPWDCGDLGGPKTTLADIERFCRSLRAAP